MLEILSVFSTVQCSCIYIGAQHAESATRVHTGPKARWGLLGLYTTHKAYITVGINNVISYEPMYPSYRINDLITSYHTPSPYLTSYIWSYFTISYPMAIVSNLTNSTLSSFMISSIIMIISFHFISHFMSSLYLYHLSSLPISSHLTVSLIWYIISHLIVNPIHHINSPNCSSLI